MTRIPLADAPALTVWLRRGRLARLGVATALVALALVAVVLAPRGDRRAGVLEPSRAGGVIVLDVSASISPSDYRRVDSVLARALASSRRDGLVLFSDVAYEALPPGTPAAELARFRRFFRPVRRGRSSRPVFRETPWTSAFTGGTRISTGLRLALEALEREGSNGRVLLLTDLVDDTRDVPALHRTVLEYERRGIPLRVVGLGRPLPADILYEQLGAGSALRGRSRTDAADGEAAEGSEPPFPFAIVAVALALLALLAANERLCGRLRFGPAEAGSR